MNAAQILRDYHKKLRGLIVQSEASQRRAPEMRAGVIGELIANANLYFTLKTELFYPAVQAGGFDEMAKGVVDESSKQLESIRDTFAGLKSMDTQDPGFEGALSEAREILLQHMNDEENELLSRVEEGLDANRLDDLGEQMRSRVHQLTKSPEYQEYRAELVQDPNGGEQKRKRGTAA